MKKIIIATRGSKLALWQANYIASRIEKKYADYKVELMIIKTTGDKILDVPLAKIGGKGLFVKELEEVLLRGQADLSVHSMKDVPAELPKGLIIGVIPERENAYDCLLSNNFKDLESLPKNAHIGTSSLRRQSQLHFLRPDLRISSLRGNLDTRVGKLLANQYDAIVVAKAGLHRLQLEAPYMYDLIPPFFYPAVAQGALGLEFMENRTDIQQILSFLNHDKSKYEIEAERAFLFTLQGGCQVPIAGIAKLVDDEINFTGLVSDIEGQNRILVEEKAPICEAKELGIRVATSILKQGGKEILDEVYAKNLNEK